MDNATIGKRVTLNSMFSGNVNAKETTISRTFKKTVLVQQYETECYESSDSITIDRPLNGDEEYLIGTILMGRLELEVFNSLFTKKRIFEQEYTTRVQLIMQTVVKAVQFAKASGHDYTSLVSSEDTTDESLFKDSAAFKEMAMNYLNALNKLFNETNDTKVKEEISGAFKNIKNALSNAKINTEEFSKYIERAAEIIKKYSNN